MTYFLTQIALALSAQFSFLDFDPHADYRTIQTTHFYIHYDAPSEEQAQRLAARAEFIYERITKKFSYKPFAKTHLVLVDNTDESNGLATPLPYNTIYLMAPPPTDDSSLDSYDDWLTTLLTHEFTHTVHIDRVEGMGRIPRYILGRLWVPNAVQQQWAIEGLAEWNETTETKGGRGRSPFVQMYLRTASLEDKFVSIDRATYWHDQWPYGNAAYWYGIGFHQFLANRYGEEKLFEITKATSATLAPGFFNFSTNDVFGKSFTRLWEEWKLEEFQKVQAMKKAHASRTQVKDLRLGKNTTLLGTPVADERGEFLYAPLEREEKKGVWKISLQGNNPIEKVAMVGTPSRVTYAKGKLYYSRITPDTPHKTFSDLYAYDLEAKKQWTLTRGMRLRDAVSDGEWVYAIRLKNYRTSLVRFRLPREPQEWQKTFPLRSAEKLETLLEAPNYDVLFKPHLSPDGKYLTFTWKEQNGFLDIYEMNLATKAIQRITYDAEEDRSPTYSADGSKIFFSSARKLGSLDVKVPNIYVFDRGSKTLTQMTDFLTGAYWPTTINSTTVALGQFHADGFELKLLDVKSAPMSPVTSFQAAPSGAVPVTKNPENTQQLPSSDYGVGNTLLPRFVLPFFFYTEHDSAVGLQTASADPLQRHQYLAYAYHLFTPQRPGGGLIYSYSGLHPVDISLAGSAGIANFGRIHAPASTTDLYPFYYERTYNGTLTLGTNPTWDGKRTDLTLSASFFFERREPLTSYPAGTIAGEGSVTFTRTGETFTNVKFSPEAGNAYGGLLNIQYGSKVPMAPEAITPGAGYMAHWTTEYVPTGKFKNLSTWANAKYFLGFSRSHGFATQAGGGLQFFKPHYLRTFQLGGSFGESLLTSVGRRSFALRGLPTSHLDGEGFVSGSLEYRFALVRTLPGFGTAPLWLKNLHAAVFTDGGQAFQWKHGYNYVEVLTRDLPEKFSWKRFTWTAGAELRSNISVLYAPPITFRLGYGHVLYLKGRNVVSDNEKQIYFQIGTSF